jgi:glycosyltransferase involved in cell wall biosynthesis
MRIAQVAPLYESVPPQLYGGTERVVSYLTEELVRQGHEVTLFASGGSATSARLVAACPRPLWQDAGCREALPHHVRLLELVAAEAARFDVVHFHTEHLHFPLARRLPCPTVTTLHSRLHAPDEQALFEEYADVPLVSISDDQRRPVLHANWQATVYHGLPRGLHTFRAGPGAGGGASAPTPLAGYLAFLGRISPEKGLEAAVEIARRAGLPLRVAARIYPGERAYYESAIEPLFRASPWVEFLGEVGGRDKDELLGNAHALLFPIDWAEPFGLVMIEAMACGTPVIAFRRGSVPEVMVEGVTGFIVDDVAGAAGAVGRVAGLSRRACRRVFEERYDAARMARDYCDVYRRLTEGARERAPAGRVVVAPEGWGGPARTKGRPGGVLGLAGAPSARAGGLA